MASYEAALDAAKRSMTIARELTDGLLSGQHPPRDVLHVYATQVDLDQAQLAELLDKVRKFKAMFSTH